jgi:dinuclear metal center YbgI/SA1388 family protein
MDCGDLCDRLDAELDTGAYADLDASANGLQVGPRDAEVDHVAFAVDAARATIDAAADAGADLLVAHHGLSWGGIERVTGRTYGRIAPLIEHDVALYVSHLPLDGHQELGNAAGIADVLDLENRVPFGDVGGEVAGQRGRLPEPLDVETLRSRLAAELDTGDGEVRALDFGPDRIRDVAVLTGSGTDWLDAAVDAGADVLVTGEGKQQVYHDAREAGIHVVLAGHYATETVGVRSLRALVEQWGPETTFVDHPTGL